MLVRSLALTSFAVAAFLPAQGVNCTLLGVHNFHAPYANIWGYVAPNGDEYALLGSQTARHSGPATSSSFFSAATAAPHSSFPPPCPPRSRRWPTSTARFAPR